MGETEKDCVIGYPLWTSYNIMSLNIHYESTKRGNREISEFQQKPNAIGNASNISPVQKQHNFQRFFTIFQQQKPGIRVTQKHSAKK